MQALCFFMSVIRSLGNHSRRVHTDRCQRKEKRERGYDYCPRQQRGPQGRKAVVGARWVPAGIHPHPAGVRGCAPLAAGSCYSIALRSCKGKKKTPTRARMHFRSVNFIWRGSQKLPNVARLHTAFVTALLVSLGHGDFWGGLQAFKKPLYLPWLLRSAEGFS